MKLYSMPNTCALAAHIVIKWTGLDIDVDVMPPGGSRLAAFLALNRHGKVPALVLDDGSVLTEAAAILPFIADFALTSNLGGADRIERARISEALGFMISEVHSDWTPHFAPQRCLSNEKGYPDLERVIFERLAPQHAFLNDALGSEQWLLFGRRTIAEGYLYMLTRTVDLMPGLLTPCALPYACGIPHTVRAGFRHKVCAG